MTDVAEDFVLLEAESRAVAGSALLTRPVNIDVAGQAALVAVDANAQRHLLVPLTGPGMDSDHASQGVTLGPRVLRVGAVDVQYADLHCRIPSLSLVFERLVEDVLQRLAFDASAPVAVCRRVLDEWRALLRAAGQGLSREVMIGLVGELEVLTLLARQNPTGAVEAWWGPTGAVHDFVRSGHAIEVKTVTSVDGTFVSISNLDQLDPALVDSLHLVVVHAREDSAGPTLDERVAALLAEGVPRDALLARVRAAGYVYESGVEVDSRFAVRSVRAWAVGDTFPGLRRGELGEARLRGVSQIRYELALDSAPRRLSDEQFEQFLVDWVSTG